MIKKSAIELAAVHGVYLGAIFSLLSCVYIVTLWLPGVSMFWLTLVCIAIIVMTKMHKVRQCEGAGYLSYTLSVNFFAVLIESIFLYLLIMAIGQDKCMPKLAEEVMKYNSSVKDFAEFKSLALDPRIHVISLSIEFFLLGVLILSPIGNLANSITVALSNRIRRGKKQL